MEAQLDIFEQAALLRDKGIENAVNHAEKAQEGWKEQAWNTFCQYLKEVKDTFQIEDFREWAQGKLSDPPSLRAFGFLPLKATKLNLIVRAGYAKVKNKKAHLTPSAVWKKA